MIVKGIRSVVKTFLSLKQNRKKEKMELVYKGVKGAEQWHGSRRQLVSCRTKIQNGGAGSRVPFFLLSCVFSFFFCLKNQPDERCARVSQRDGKERIKDKMVGRIRSSEQTTKNAVLFFSF